MEKWLINLQSTDLWTYRLTNSQDRQSEPPSYTSMFSLKLELGGVFFYENETIKVFEKKNGSEFYFCKFLYKLLVGQLRQNDRALTY